MNKSQRQEQILVSSISGRKISNFFACTIKQVRRLSPPIYQQINRQETFQTDSFKQILTRRSGAPNNKENIILNNKGLKKIKEESLKSKEQCNLIKKNPKSGNKKLGNKSSTISLTKLIKRDKSMSQLRKRQTKSISPSRDTKDYRSGPVQKRNYLSNNNQSSKTSRLIIPSNSQKNLVQKTRNPTKSLINFEKGQIKKISKNQSKKLLKHGKAKVQNSKIIYDKNKSQNQSKTEAIAKQFDQMIKNKNYKSKKQTNNKKKSKSKSKQKINKQKRIIVSKSILKNSSPKQKISSIFSHESQNTPQKQNQQSFNQIKRKQKRQRQSFQPARSKSKLKNKAKTEAFSPQKNLQNKNNAAIKIQKVFRGFLTRKYIKQYYKIQKAAIAIQRMWRLYKLRKSLASKKIENQKLSIQKNIQQNIEQFQTFRQSSIKPRNQLLNLLEDILNQQSINQSIKHKINNYLNKQTNSLQSSKSPSHLQQQIQSEKRYFDEIQRRKNKSSSPLSKSSPKKYHSPILQKQQFKKSPQIIIQSLLTIKELQKQKLISYAKMQIQGIQSLTLKKIFSPRTRDIKKQQIHNRLHKDLQKFDESISEVINTCKVGQEIIKSTKPFRAISTPQRNLEQKKLQFQQSPRLSFQKSNIQKLNNSQQNKLQDLSMQLLQYYQQKTNVKESKQYERLDNSYLFIQQYLLSLFQYLRQLGHSFRQNFIEAMRNQRNLSAQIILKNLNILTEDSDDEDISFKLPMYKYLQQEKNQILSLNIVQNFNLHFKKLQRHQLGLRNSVQQMYLKMIIDAINEALVIQRPCAYLFTQASLIGRSIKLRLKQLQGFDGLDGQDNQPQFSYYFANSMNYIYKWAHFQCGKMKEEENEQSQIVFINQANLKQYLQVEAKKSENYYDELLQVVVELSSVIFDQIMFQQGITLYM